MAIAAETVLYAPLPAALLQLGEVYKVHGYILFPYFPGGFYLRREAQRRYSSYGFSIIFSDTSKKGLNSPNKHGCICNLGHKFQI